MCVVDVESERAIFWIQKCVEDVSEVPCLDVGRAKVLSLERIVGTFDGLSRAGSHG